MWRRKNKEKEEVRKATRARDEATESLHEIQAREPEVSEVSESLRTLRERNHFAEQIQAILEGI